MAKGKRRKPRGTSRLDRVAFHSLAWVESGDTPRQGTFIECTSSDATVTSVCASGGAGESGDHSRALGAVRWCGGREFTASLAGATDARCPALPHRVRRTKVESTRSTHRGLHSPIGLHSRPRGGVHRGNSSPAAAPRGAPGVWSVTEVLPGEVRRRAGGGSGAGYSAARSRGASASSSRRSTRRFNCSASCFRCSSVAWVGVGVGSAMGASVLTRNSAPALSPFSDSSRTYTPPGSRRMLRRLRPASREAVRHTSGCPTDGWHPCRRHGLVPLPWQGWVVSFGCPSRCRSLVGGCLYLGPAARRGTSQPACCSSRVRQAIFYLGRLTVCQM